MAEKKKKADKSHKTESVYLILVLLLAFFILGSAFLFREQLRSRNEQQLYEELTRIQQMVTYRQTYRSVFYTSVKENFLQERTLLFTADFQVAAGIDLSRGFTLDAKGDSVHLTLPAGTILYVDADDTSLEQVFVKERFSSITTGDYLPLLTEEKQNILNQAREGGIEKDAEQRAEQIFMGILKMAGFQRAAVSFRRDSL